MDASIVQISGCSAAGTGLCMLSCSQINDDQLKWAIFVRRKAGGLGQIHKIIIFAQPKARSLASNSHEFQGPLELEFEDSAAVQDQTSREQVNREDQFFLRKKAQAFCLISIQLSSHFSRIFLPDLLLN